MSKERAMGVEDVKRGHAGHAAALLASRGESDRAMEAAKEAARLGELLHPAGWALWDKAEDGLFERALGLASESERRWLGEQDEALRGWAAALSGSSRKVRAMINWGADAESSRCCGSPGVGAVAFLACLCETQRLLALKEAGVSAPGGLSQAELDVFQKMGYAWAAGAASAADLLSIAIGMAWNESEWPTEQREAGRKEAARWLIEGLPSAEGALRRALMEGCAEVARAALEAGADSGMSLEGGWSAQEGFEYAMRDGWGPQKREKLRVLEGVMRAAQEERELGEGKAPGEERPLGARAPRL